MAKTKAFRNLVVLTLVLAMAAIAVVPSVTWWIVRNYNYADYSGNFAYAALVGTAILAAEGGRWFARGLLGMALGPIGFLVGVGVGLL